MSKYHDLIKVYENSITDLKSAYADYDKLMDTAKELQSMTPDMPNYDDYLSDWLDAGELYDEITDMEHALYDEIAREYEAVPFVKARNQGISGFYREAGLPIRGHN